MQIRTGASIKFTYPNKFSYTNTGNFIEPRRVWITEVLLYMVFSICFAVAAQVMSEPRKFKKETLQLKYVEETSCELKGSDSEEDEPYQIEVHNVPDKVNEKLLKLYFEGEKSGGCDGAVAECRQIQQGIFIVTFHDPKGKGFYNTDPAVIGSIYCSCS